jgi:hypothetical protein
VVCQFDSRTKEIERNLIRLYHKATDADVVQGIAWYPEARRIVCEWATTYCYHDDTVAGVIAALSPQMEWTRNLICADDILAGRPPSVLGLRSNIAKARLMRDSNPSESLSTRMMRLFPSGPKVNSFALNLAGDNSVVTVDTHAMQAGLNNVMARYTLPWRPYRVFAECYARAAVSVAESPATFQAIIWHAWKRFYPRGVKNQLRKQWEVLGEY